MIAKTWPAGLSLAVAALLAGAPAASAQEASNVTLRGFVSQGYPEVVGEPLARRGHATKGRSPSRRPPSTSPRSPCRRCAWPPSSSRATSGRRATTAWSWTGALGEYRAWDQLGFRIGRVKFPVGLYNTLAGRRRRAAGDLPAERRLSARAARPHQRHRRRRDLRHHPARRRRVPRVRGPLRHARPRRQLPPDAGHEPALGGPGARPVRAALLERELRRRRSARAGRSTAGAATSSGIRPSPGCACVAGCRARASTSRP